MNKRVTIPFIKEFNPCEDGLENLVKHYPKLDMLTSEFLTLEYVSYNDKTWLAQEVVDIKTLQQWAVECAESVVSNYNERYPLDSRITDCIETTKLYLEGKCSKEELLKARSAAHSAAHSAYSAAYSAANSTNSAAYSAAHSAANSAAHSAYAAVHSAHSAAHSASNSAARGEKQDINLSLLIALLENNDA